jgi:hypothetical protein
MVVQRRVVLARLWRERDAVRRRPGLSDELVQRLPSAVEGTKNTKFPSPRDLDVEALRIALAAEAARPVPVSLPIPDHPLRTFAMHAHDSCRCYADRWVRSSILAKVVASGERSRANRRVFRDTLVPSWVHASTASAAMYHRVPRLTARSSPRAIAFRTTRSVTPRADASVATVYAGAGRSAPEPTRHRSAASASGSDAICDRSSAALGGSKATSS